MKRWKLETPIEVGIALTFAALAGFLSESFWTGLAFLWIFLTAFETSELRIRCRGIELRVADLDRDLTALEGSLTGDGR
jgi:hypothetical protein